jgi:hypothetical protein
MGSVRARRDSERDSARRRSGEYRLIFTATTTRSDRVLSPTQASSTPLTHAVRDAVVPCRSCKARTRVDMVAKTRVKNLFRGRLI